MRQDCEPVKKKILKRSLLCILIFLMSLMIYALFAEPGMISVNTVSIADDHLYNLFGDKKVVHISDLHITSIGYREKRLIEMINEISPDILFITGDLLTDGKDEDACIEVLKRINSPAYGIWVVLGNTDRFVQDEPNKNITGFIKKLKKLGIRVLEDSYERLVLNDRGDHIFIAGVEYPYLSRSRLDWLLTDIPADAPIILLSHYPDILENNTDALTVNLKEYEGEEVPGWEWQDNYYFEHGSAIVRFESTGRHKLRVQRREDGVAIEQISLVMPANENSHSDDVLKGPAMDRADIYKKINPDSGEMIIIKVKDISSSDIYGAWRKVDDPDAAYNPVIKDLSGYGAKNDAPLLEPEDYFEADFYAEGGVDYHVWLRMKAGSEGNEVSPDDNDSVHLQFSDSMNRKGEPVYRIGGPGTRDNLRRINLILAGHTHGGQVRVPFIGSLNVTPGHNLKYDMGLYEDQGTVMYVNRGIGTSTFPVRFLCPPEITVFKYMKKNNSADMNLRKAS